MDLKAGVEGLCQRGLVAEGIRSGPPIDHHGPSLGANVLKSPKMVVAASLSEAEEA